MYTKIERSKPPKNEKSKAGYTEWFRAQVEASLNDKGEVLDDEATTAIFARASHTLLGS